jgi:AraC-like DNA-binding protein
MSAWFCHGRGGGDPLQQQHELYALMIMIQVIRLGLGAAWKPSRIRLQLRGASSIADNEFLRSINDELGSPVTGIAIDRVDLAAPIESPIESRSYILPHSHSPIHGKAANALPVDHLIALQELIHNQLRRSVPPTVELAAEEAGVSKRTLQRYLASRSTSFSKLLDQVRYDMAVHLLQEDTLSVTDISHELGYSNVAHFSRAFSRVTGMSPRTYRGLLKK